MMHKIVEEYKAYTLNEVINKKIDIEDAQYAVFEKDEKMDIDEGLKIKDGKLSLSSFANGLVDWDKEKGEYIHMYHGMSSSLGKLKHIVFSD